MSLEGKRQQPPADEKSQSEPRPEPSRRHSSATGSQSEHKSRDADNVAVEYGDSRRHSVSVNEGELGSLPPIDEHPRSVNHLGSHGTEKSDPASPVSVAGDNVDIAKDFLEAIMNESQGGQQHKLPQAEPISKQAVKGQVPPALQGKPTETLKIHQTKGGPTAQGEPSPKTPLTEKSSEYTTGSMTGSSEDESEGEGTSSGSDVSSTVSSKHESLTKQPVAAEPHLPPRPPPPPVPRPLATSKVDVSAEVKPSESSSSYTSRTESTTASSSGSETVEGTESVASLERALGKEAQKVPLAVKDGRSISPESVTHKETTETAERTAATSMSTSKTTTKGTTRGLTRPTITSVSGSSPISTVRPQVPIAPVQPLRPREEDERRPLVPKGGNDPLVYAMTNNEAHREVESKTRRIPCTLLLLDVFAALFLLLLSCVVLIATMQKQTPATTAASATEAGKDHVCRGVQCGVSGTHLFYVLNTSANPCDSVYNYVCKNWIHESPANYRKVVLGAQRVFIDNVYTEMRHILTSPEIGKSESAAVRKAASLYRDCLTKPFDQWEGMTAFRNMMKSYELHNWPFKNHFFSFPYQSLAKFLRDSGSGAVISVKVAREAEKDHSRLLALDCSTFVVPIGTLLAFSDHRDITLYGYKQYVVDVFNFLNAGSKDSEEHAHNVMAFEINLAHRCNEGCRRKKYKKVRLDNLSKVTGPGVSWMPFLETVFQDAGLFLSRDTQILVRSVRYLKAVSMLFSNDSTLPRLMNYVGWRVAHHFLRQASVIARNFTDRFMELRIKEEREPYWRKCLRDANDVMPLAVGRIYIEKVLWQDNHLTASRMVLSLLESLDNTISRFAWADDYVRKEYRKMKDLMDYIISFPPWIKDTIKLDKYYEKMKSRGVYFDRFLSASRTTYQMYLETVKQQEASRELMNFIFPTRVVDLGQRTGPPRERLFYDVRDNTVIVPAGALQPPYYEHQTVAGLNFGGLGTLIARDIINEWFHTSEGLLNANNKDVFMKKSQCLLNSMKEGLGSQSSPECTSVVTDVFTLRLAYEGYQIFLDGGDDQTLKGIDFVTPDQLFFVSAVRTLCTSIRERYYSQVVLLGRQVTEIDLIDSAVMSMREFDDAFNCTRSKTVRQNLFNKCFESASR